MSIESVMSSNHLILFHPLLLLPSIFPSIRVFSNEKGRIVDIKSEFKCLLLFSTTRINFPLAMCVFGHVHMFLCKNIYLFEPPYTSKAYEKLNFPGKRHGNPLQYSCLKIPWTEEPGGLHSMESQRIGHDWEHNTKMKLIAVSRRLSEAKWFDLSNYLNFPRCFHTAWRRLVSCSVISEVTFIHEP